MVIHENDCILDVQDLEVRFFQDEGTVRAVNGVSFNLNAGQAIGLVGESGCGKTVTAYSVMRLLPRSGKITAGEIKYKKASGEVIDLAKLSDGKEMSAIRGAEISMVFQEPMSSLSPVHSVLNQVSESILLHQQVSTEEAIGRTVDILTRVGIPDAEARMYDYPFQFSGGMRQRVMIAMALACNPRILIADEPTTALDVTIQAQVLKLIKEMQQEMNLSLILITHDMGVIAQMVDYVYVMYLGCIVEEGDVREIFNNPQHPYTRALLRSIPKLRGPKEELASIEGSVPSASALPTGCTFHTRCKSIVGDICRRQRPSRTDITSNHRVYCFLHSDRKVETNDQYVG